MKIMPVSSEEALVYVLRTVGAPKELANSLREEFKFSEVNDTVLFVRFESGYLQWLQVVRQFLNEPDVEKSVQSHEWWTETQVNHMGENYDSSGIDQEATRA